jgi:hypothetical protein
LHTGESEIVDQENHGKAGVKPSTLGKRGHETKKEPHHHGCGVNRALRAKMVQAFERRVDEIDWENEGEKQKDLAVDVTEGIHARNATSTGTRGRCRESSGQAEQIRAAVATASNSKGAFG